MHLLMKVFLFLPTKEFKCLLSTTPVCCLPFPLPFLLWIRSPEPSLPAPCSVSALWVLYLGVGVGFKPWQSWTKTDHFFRKPHLAREARDKSSHSHPPTAKQQRYLCHSASPHLRSGISRCLGLISCRAGGRALLQLSQAEYELIFPASCPTLPSDFKEGREHAAEPCCLTFPLMMLSWTQLDPLCVKLVKWKKIK